MGGMYYTMFIGRQLTDDEITVFKKLADTLVDEDKLSHYEENRRLNEYLMVVEGHPVICFWEIEQFYVCQHYIGNFGNEDSSPRDVDYTRFPKPHDSRYGLQIVGEYN